MTSSPANQVQGQQKARPQPQTSHSSIRFDRNTLARRTFDCFNGDVDDGALGAQRRLGDDAEGALEPSGADADVAPL